MQECKNTQTQRGTRSRSTKTAISFLSRQMQQLFYENYEQNKKGYIRDLHNSKIHRAITLHPNKNPPEL